MQTTISLICFEASLESTPMLATSSYLVSRPYEVPYSSLDPAILAILQKSDSVALTQLLVEHPLSELQSGMAFATAAQNGQSDLVRGLLESRIVKVTDWFLGDALIRAATIGNEQIVLQLLETGRLDPSFKGQALLRLVLACCFVAAEKLLSSGSIPSWFLREALLQAKDSPGFVKIVQSYLVRE